ncbi:MAG: hypothetical protein ACP5U2_12585 [Bryobacteraceae bacterium]
MLVRNEQRQYVNILTGGIVDDVEAWKQRTSEIIAQQRQASEEWLQKALRPEAAFDRQMDELVRRQAEEDKVLQNLSQMERYILCGSGPESHWVKGPGEPGDLLTHIRAVRQQLIEGKEFDRQEYDQLLRVYKDIKQGAIVTESELPRGSTLDREILTETLLQSAREFLTGQKADGSTSWLGIAGRALTGAVTGGATEFVLAPAEALQETKDYVDAGGNSVFEGFSKAASHVIVSGRIGRVIGAAGRGGGPSRTSYYKVGRRCGFDGHAAITQRGEVRAGKDRHLHPHASPRNPSRPPGYGGQTAVAGL